MKRGGRAALPAAAALVIVVVGCAAACAALSAVRVNSWTAAATISSYRLANGLGPVTASARLNAIARRQAEAMAMRRVLSHTVIGSLGARLKSGGYTFSLGAENIASGREDFEAALAGWKRSPGHRANLLRRGVSEIGVAAARSDGNGSRVYWALVLAAPAGSGRVLKPGG